MRMSSTLNVVDKENLLEKGEKKTNTCQDIYLCEVFSTNFWCTQSSYILK